ncbi:substrate-binding domain-containing protein [Myceligenerans crystallogenes]|uniref:Substrate-binding domain-containing protein n=1 Tax=Myceligenerans crystallogenes TaxID=316335 RepID=A0ABN2NJ22_9MICO
MTESPAPFAVARRELILDELRRTGAVRVADLARRFKVTPLTIRRDMGYLADRGLVTRVHGGATLRSRLDTTVPTHHPGDHLQLFRVGMVVPSLNYYWPQVITGARAAAAELNVQIVLRGASYYPEDQRLQISSLAATGSLHGLVVAPETSGADGLALLHWLDTLDVPVVLAERRLPSTLALTRLNSVTTNHVFGGALAGRHLADLGHQVVGIVTSTGSPTSGHLRRGWVRALDDHGLSCHIDLDIERSDLEGPRRQEIVTGILSRCRETGTTALLVHSDPEAVVIQQTALDQGWNVPGDLSIIAYDDEVAENAEPAITALRPPKHEVGQLAIEMMVRRLRTGAAMSAQRTYLLPTLHRRASTGSVTSA